MSLAPPHLDGWLPYRARWRGDALAVDWARLGERSLDPAFFEHTVAQMLAMPFNQLFRLQTDERVLRDRAEAHPGLAPAGFVFHMSRCGSTLVSRLLGALPRSMVISEASPIDAVLQGLAHVAQRRPDMLAERLRWILAALAQPRGGDEQRLFVKLDSWHMRAWPLIEAAFPGKPWVFVHRDPVEVLASQITHAGAHFQPDVLAPELLAVERAHGETPLEDYVAQALGGICRAALDRFAQGGGLLIGYEHLPQAFEAVAAHFGAAPEPSFRATVESIAGKDSKRSATPFASDAAAKQGQASAAIRMAAERWVTPLHRELQRQSWTPAS